LGAEHAKGRVLAFHNDDSMADPTWLALALGEFDRVSDLGVATCRVVSMNGPVLQHEGSSMTHPHGLFWQTGYGIPDYPPSLRDTASVDLDYFGGCIWATSREVWERVGGLAPAYYPGYYEDSEYALRCRQLGYRIRLLKAVTCSHIMNATLGPQASRFWRVFHRSRYLFLLRNRVGFGWKEIIDSELGWWHEHSAGHNPGLCLSGLLSALPKAPGALLERRRFGKRIKDEALGA
jgi:GT2 family glycosyltransferase